MTEIIWTERKNHIEGVWRGVKRFRIVFNAWNSCVLIETLPHKMQSQHDTIEDAKAHAARRVAAMEIAR